MKKLKRSGTRVRRDYRLGLAIPVRSQRAAGVTLAPDCRVPLVRSPLTELVIGCAIEVHRQLGPGLLESVYHRCLVYELGAQRLSFVTDQVVPVAYKDLQFHCGHRVDLIVEGRLVLELKSVEHLLPVHKAQLLTYLRLLRIEQGLLVNFHVPRLADGIKSVVLSLKGPQEDVKA